MRQLFVLLLVFSALAGCVSAPVPPTEFQSRIHRVVIVTPPEFPALDFRGIAKGKVEGAALTGGATFVGCVAALGAGPCVGPVCGPMVALWVGVCGVAGLAGGGVGAALTPSAGKQKRDAAVAARSLAAQTLQQSLGAELADAARQRGIGIVDAGSNPDAEIEARITSVGARGGIGGPLTVFMNAHVIARSAVDNTLLTEFDFQWQGDTRDRAEWLRDDAAPLREELVNGWKSVAADIADRVFLLYPMPYRKMQSHDFAGHFGLDALSPQTILPLSNDVLIGRHIEWPDVDSLQPLLRWEAFPREADMTIAPEEMSRITGVRYDIRIARAHDNLPAEIVYARDGLPTPEYRPETPLTAGMRYFWTVRARFLLDGRERVTEWSDMNYRSFGKAAAPSAFSFRFRAPPQ